MEPRAVYEKNSEEISTNLFRGVAATPPPVTVVENDSKDDTITWFRRLSPEQKSTSRFSLPDWLRRSKGASSVAEKDDSVFAEKKRDTPPHPLHHTSSLPNLNVESKQDEKPVPVTKNESGLNSSFLAPLVELGQKSSRLRIEVPWKQEVSKLTSPSQQRPPPPQAKLSLPLRSGGQRGEDSEARSPWEYGFGKQPARSLATVLRHLSTIVDRSGQVPQDYRDSDFKQYWMPDNQCKECYECGEKFTTLRRRHHCRICGQIFCRRCCNQEVPGKFMGYTGNLRVCTYCCKVVLSYAQSSIGELKMLQEDYFTLVASEMPSSATPDLMTPRKKMADSTMTRQRTFSSGSAEGSFNPFELVRTPTPSSLKKSFDSVAQERQHLLKDSAQLHQLWKLIQHPSNGIMFQNHRFRLRTYNDCIVGSELVDWLLLKDKATHRLQAVAIGQALLDAKWLESATSHDLIFHDEYALYRAGKTARSSTRSKDLDINLTAEGELEEIEDRMEPSWFRDIDLEDKGDLTDDDGLVTIMPNQSEEIEVEVVRKHQRHTSMGDSIGTWTRALRPTTDLFTSPGPDKAAMETLRRETSGPWEQEGTLPGIGEVFPNGALSTFGLDQADQARGPILAHGWLDMDTVSQENGELETLDTLRSASSRTLVNLAEQQLGAEGLDLSWKETILTLAKRICSLVKPDVMNGDDMDIRHYVHIKKVPGGSRADCFMVNGTICTKNVAHKKMSGHLSNPRILLLQSAIEHQRVENKFSSIEPIVLQEHEYLKNCVARIASLKPDILIVEKTVARLAQTFLLHNGITLVLNVKPSVMDRLSRCTEVSLIPSIDQVNQTTPMGHCLMFRLQKYELPKGFSKTLMFFEGCPTHLGCSVVLRGGEHELLNKVKRVLRFMVYASYHTRLEISFLMDEFVKPPSQSQEADAKAIISPETNLAVSPTIGVSEGLASIQDAMMDGGTSDQVDIVSEQALAEELELKDEAGKVGFRATVSSMKKLIKAKVASVKAHSHPDSEQELESRRESAQDVYEGIKIPKDATENEMLEEIAEETSVAEDHETESPEKLLENDEEVEAESEQIISSSLKEQDDGTLSQLAESADSLKPIKSNQSKSNRPLEHQEVTQLEQVSSPKSLGPMPDFDHEATTKEIESKFLEMRRNKLISEDSASIESHEDMPFVSPVPALKNKSAFSTALEEALLSISPLVKFHVPYLESKAGRESLLRCFFPSKEFYWSPKLSQQAKPTHGLESADSRTVEADMLTHAEQMYGNVDRCSRTSDAVIVKPPHPFMFSQLTEDAKDDTMRSLLADFRARGGRIIQRSPQVHQPAQKQSANGQVTSKGTPEMIYRRQVDCLDIYNHQRMLLQFCSYSHLSSNAPNHCVNPWTVSMEYYSNRHDLTLGEFLERYCFSTKYKCPNELCDADMVDHIRRFVHGNASIHILLRNLESPIPGFTDKILMWSWCRKCRQVTPVQPMSLDSWHMSFGKYLELRFHCKDYGRRLSALPCGHSLHRHHYQYFGQHNIVASFKYSPILLREICFPPLPLHIQQTFRSHPAPAEEFKNVSSKGSQLLSDLHSKINALTGINVANIQTQQYFEQRNAQFIAQYQVDNNKFWHNAKDVQSKITSLGNLMASANQTAADIADIQLDIEDSIVNLKQSLCGIAVSWNNRLGEFIQQEKERNKKKSSPSVSRQNTPNVDKETSMAVLAAAAVKEVELDTPHAVTPPKSPRFHPPVAKDEPRAPPQGSNTLPMVIPQLVGHDSTLPTPVAIQIEGSYDANDDESLESSRSRGDSDVTAIHPSIAYLDHLGNPKMPNYGISPGLYAGLAYKPRTESADDESDNDLTIVELPANEDAEPAEAGVCPAPTTEAATDKEGETKQAVVLTEGTDHPDFTATTQGETQQASTYKSKQSNSSMKTFFSTLLPGSDLARVETPYPPDEHHLLPPCTVIPVIIYDQEPSSIIAYALSSEQYKTQLYELQQPDLLKPSEGASQPGSNPESKNTSPTARRHAFNENSQGQVEGKERPKKGQLTRKASRGVISFLRGKIPDSASSTASSSQRKDEGQFTYPDAIHYQVAGIDEPSSTSSFTETKDESDFDFSLRSGAEKRDVLSPHIELQFSDGTNTQFFCLVYHADQFLQLRKTVFPVGEETYIRSLSRSVTWLAQGGKSRSKFLKTKDDRFVLKQISRLEFQSFKEFAPHYFKYIQQAYTEQRPTTLAKILGVYKVGYHNPVTNTAQKHVLLIMENLFYQRRMAQVFDLKGSIRNRHVKTTGQEQQDLVLMDENLLKHMVDSPLFIRSHSKAALTMAVHYDSTFLASHFIMDYSLLVGLDTTSDELVVGIIDYIRTFTWDKKLEMMVKSTGIVGGQGKMPTVVSPELYRTRFCEAMHKYFLLVPDRWSNLGSEF